MKNSTEHPPNHALSTALIGAFESFGMELTSGALPKGLAPKVAHALNNCAYRWPTDPVVLFCMDALAISLERADLAPPVNEPDAGARLKAHPMLQVIAELPAGDVEDVVIFMCIVGHSLSAPIDPPIQTALKILRTQLALPKFGHRNTLNAKQRNHLAELTADSNTFHSWWLKVTNAHTSLAIKPNERDLCRCLKNLSELVLCVDRTLAPQLELLLETAPEEREHYALNEVPLGALTSTMALSVEDDWELLQNIDDIEEESGPVKRGELSHDTYATDEYKDIHKTSSWAHIGDSTIFAKTLLRPTVRKTLGDACKSALDAAEERLRHHKSLGVDELCAIAVYSALILPCNPHDDRLMHTPYFSDDLFPLGIYVSRSIFRADSQFQPLPEVAHYYTSPVTRYMLEIPSELQRVTKLIYKHYGENTTLGSFFATLNIEPEKAIKGWLKDVANQSHQPVIRINSFNNELREFSAAHFDMPAHTIYCLLAAPNHAPVTDSYYASIRVSRLRTLYTKLVEAYLEGKGYE